MVGHTFMCLMGIVAATYMVWVSIPVIVIPFFESPNLPCFFGIAAFAMFLLGTIYAIYLYLRCHSFYQLTSAGIVIKTLCFTRILRWEEIRLIGIYTLYRAHEIKGGRDYIVICKKGAMLPEQLIEDVFFRREKSVFLIRYTEERAAEFAQYWPNEIRRARYYQRTNKER